MTVTLRAQSVGKSFTQRGGDPLPILENITLDLQAGEIVCLLGASGSGKTTLLRILSGLDRAYDGVVESEIARPDNAVGYLSQNDELLPWRSAVANVALGLELAGQDKKTAHQAALAALQQVGLSNFASHYPAALSDGMKQRVLLARMLALQPKLLLLDEPMSNLDVLARRELSVLIKNYTRQSGAATLVVTHSVEEACFLADRIILITRSPARLFKEIRLKEVEAERGKALDIVMNGLWQALGVVA